MQDCKLIITIKDDKIEMDADKCGIFEIACICGVLEQIVGLRAVRMGQSLEDVKTSMLDVHLAAMDNLTTQLIEEHHIEDILKA